MGDMRNPRRLILNDSLTKTHKLSKSSPPTDSLFWKMWRACASIAGEALDTDFIQGIKGGTLNPIKFGGFNVNDAYYCFQGARDYQTADDRAEDPALKAFLYSKFESYGKYNQEFPKIWHVKDASGVSPAAICRAYSAYESSVVKSEAPIYALIVMLPCEYLWSWLAEQIAPPASGNLYADWISSNLESDGAYAIGNFLDSFQKQYPDQIDEKKALEIYTKAMTFEMENFKAATA